MTLSSEGHTYRRYDGELSHLHYLVLELGGLALTQVRDALECLRTRNLEMAHKVLDRENLMDLGEVNADAEIVKLIARRSPVGSDLRLVFAVSKSVTDLERIGDEAVKIANLALQIFGTGSDPNSQLLRDVNTMGALAVKSLERSLQIVDQRDEQQAVDLIRDHAEMDEEFQSGLRRLMTFIMEDSRNIGFAVDIVLIIKALERIGDHACNLAEYLLFQLSGEDVRHQATVLA